MQKHKYQAKVKWEAQKNVVKVWTEKSPFFFSEQWCYVTSSKLPFCRTWIRLCRTWWNTNQLPLSHAHGRRQCSRILVMLSQHFNVVQKDLQAGRVSLLPWPSDTWSSCLSINRPIFASVQFLPTWSTVSCQDCSHQHPRLLTFRPLAWCSHQLTQSPFYSQNISSPASDLQTQSQKQASLSHHKLKLRQSLCRCEYPYSFFISLLLKMAISNPLQSAEMYNRSSWLSDSLMQTSCCCCYHGDSLTVYHAANLFGLTFLNSNLVFLSAWKHLHLIAPYRHLNWTHRTIPCPQNSSFWESCHHFLYHFHITPQSIFPISCSAQPLSHRLLVFSFTKLLYLSPSIISMDTLCINRFLCLQFLPFPNQPTCC